MDPPTVEQLGREIDTLEATLVALDEAYYNLLLAGWDDAATEVRHIADKAQVAVDDKTKELNALWAREIAEEGDEPQTWMIPNS